MVRNESEPFQCFELLRVCTLKHKLVCFSDYRYILIVQEIFMLACVVNLFGFQSIGLGWVLLGSSMSNFKHLIFLSLKGLLLIYFCTKPKSEVELSLFLTYIFFYFDHYLTFKEQNIKDFFKLYINKMPLFFIFRYTCAQVLLSFIITH